MNNIGLNYEDTKKVLRVSMKTMTRSFVAIGYYLKLIRDTEGFKNDKYETIWEFAEKEFGLQRTTASRWMAINDRFSEGGDSPKLAERYENFGKSQLQEMLYLSDEEMEKVTTDMTVKEIRNVRTQEPVSPYGLTKTVRPEGSLLNTPGCGGGKHDCFSCSQRECEIRQEERQCMFVGLGTKAPCGQMKNENIKWSLYKDECMFLHPELAPVREGDKEPTPCCLECEVMGCTLACCDRKKAQKKEKEKQREAEVRKEIRERNEARPMPTEKELELAYDYFRIKESEEISAEALKDKYRNAGGGGGAIRDWQGSTRGLRINYKQEITWAAVVKAFKEIQADRKAQHETEIETIPGQMVIEDYPEVLPEPELTEQECAMPHEEPEMLEGTEKEPKGWNVVQPAEEESWPRILRDIPEFQELPVLDYLMDEEKILKEYISCSEEEEGFPGQMLQRQQMKVAGLRLLYDLVAEKYSVVDVEDNEDDT